MKVKKQHFVPRFYLKHFVSEENKIWVFDKDEKKSFPSSINNVACEGYFYDDQNIDNEKNTEQYLENLFAEYESRIAPKYTELLKKIKRSNEYELSLNDKSIIAGYLVTQIDRTKEHREEAYQFTLETYNQLKEKGFTEEQLIQMGFDTNQFDKKELHLESIIAGDGMRETLVEILMEHIWIIYKNETSHSFFTSDRPIVKNGHIKDKFISNEGYASPGIEIAFPLNPQYILILCDRDYFSKYEYLDGKISLLSSFENVKYYNSLQVISCYRQIFSDEHKFGIIEEILRNTPTAFELNRKRIG